jgi:hypothetical protein
LFAISCNADSHISNAVFPTKRDDILALISRTLSHVAIELDPFAGFLKGLPAPTSKLKSRKHEYLSSYLGSVFELGEAIAKGAYGEVFRATRTVNGIAIVMALKVFDHKISESDVRAEFAILQRLQQLCEILCFYCLVVIIILARLLGYQRRLIC